MINRCIGLEKRSTADRSRRAGRSRAGRGRAGRSRARRRGNRHREARAAGSNRRRWGGARPRGTSVVILAVDRRSTTGNLTGRGGTAAGDLARTGRSASRDLTRRGGAAARDIAGVAELTSVKNASGTLGVARREDRSGQVRGSRRTSRVAGLAELREGGSTAQESREGKSSELHIGGM